jgi:hypothetical protein
MTHEPNTGREIYEQWLTEKPDPDAEGSGCAGILTALALDAALIAVVAAAITFVMWTLR